MKKDKFPLRYRTIKFIKARVGEIQRKRKTAEKPGGIANKISDALEIALTRAVIATLKKDFGDIVEEYAKKEENANTDTDGVIWICWLQGEESAPPLIKRCIESIRTNAKNHKVVLIDRHNVHEYIDLPDYIIQKYEQKLMIPAHLSDIIRMCLLAKYGGLWIDSSMFCAYEIGEDIWNMPLYTSRGYYKSPLPNTNEREKEESGCAMLWLIGVMGGKKGHPFFCFARDMKLQYWKKYSTPMTYLMLDCILRLAYNTIGIAKRDIDAIPRNAKSWLYLWDIFHTAYDKEKIAALTCDGTLFFKIGWRESYEMYTKAGEETVYKRFLDGTLS
ncbi:MAG: capsular polysaccharide synthesis protein [Oscillospiraceae bacterium]|nr:capsular polysaccharide synthesis protein [Oscillospiraceae bacterium]